MTLNMEILMIFDRCVNIWGAVSCLSGLEENAKALQLKCSRFYGVIVWR